MWRLKKLKKNLDTFDFLVMFFAIFHNFPLNFGKIHNKIRPHEINQERSIDLSKITFHTLLWWTL